MGIKYTGSFKVTGTTKVAESFIPPSNLPPDFSGVADEQFMQASDALNDAFHGYSVGMDGDTCIVGASSHFNSGQAYTLERDNDGLWTETQKFKGSDTTSFDSFGIAVAIDGDTCIVGATGHDAGGSNAGAAYIFTRTDGVWTQQQKIWAGDREASADFGRAVAIDGDTCIVGAPRRDVGVSDAGAAYIFTRTDGVWTQQQKIWASDREASARFGQGVAIDGDTCVAGAFFDDYASKSNSGAAYFFTRTDGVWTQQQKVGASDSQANGYFGQVISISGTTCAISSPRTAGDVGSSEGSVYIFDATDGVWAETQKIEASDPEISRFFGNSISIDDDTLAVGAALDDGKAIDAGAAYVFTRTNGTWNEAQKFVASNGLGGDHFGNSVSISGGAFISGAPHRASGNRRGAVYIYTAKSETNSWE